MSTFVVQAASGDVMHCYVEGHAAFDVGSISLLHGVKRVHLVTAGRAPEKWCLVLEPQMRVEQGNAPFLRQLIGRIARQVGCAHVALRRAVTRPTVEQGPATDIYDWLKM